MKSEIAIKAGEAQKAIEYIAYLVFLDKGDYDTSSQALDRLIVIAKRCRAEMEIIEDNFKRANGLMDNDKRKEDEKIKAWLNKLKGDPESLNNQNAQDVAEATNSANVGEDEKTS